MGNEVTEFEIHEVKTPYVGIIRILLRCFTAEQSVHWWRHDKEAFSVSALFALHYIDVMMTTMASQITSLTIVYSSVYSGANQRKHQSSASLTGEFPAQRASNAENVSIWWRHQDQLQEGHRHLDRLLKSWQQKVVFFSGVLSTTCVTRKLAFVQINIPQEIRVTRTPRDFLRVHSLQTAMHCKGCTWWSPPSNLCTWTSMYVTFSALVTFRM